MVLRLGLGGALAGLLATMAFVHVVEHLDPIRPRGLAPRARIGSILAPATSLLGVASSPHKAGRAPEGIAPRRPQASRGVRRSPHRRAMPAVGDLLGSGLES